MKGGKSVPNCVKEDYINYLIDHRFATDEESAEQFMIICLISGR